jgi:hypothetical protein
MMEKKTQTVPKERKKPPYIFGATYKMLRCNKYNILENKIMNRHVGAKALRHQGTKVPRYQGTKEKATLFFS